MTKAIGGLERGPSRATMYLTGGGEMGARMRAFDWSKTALGPVDTWPQCLLSVVGMLLPSKAQKILFWGPEFTALYNDPYRAVLGARHPSTLGRPGREVWPEIWDGMLHGLLDGVVQTGEAFGANDLLFPIERNGYPEETYFDVSYDPVRDETGNVAGVYCIVTETTARVVGERRLALLKDLAANNANSIRKACELAMKALEQRPHDIRFALVYRGDELLAHTPDAPALATAAPDGQIRERPLLRVNGTVTVIGRLVLGLHPTRPYDTQHASFLDLVAGQVSTVIVNARAYEEERQRAKALAELDRAKTVFFNNVSHELRTPLTLILGPVENLTRSGQLDAHVKETLELVNRNALRLLRLVNTLLDFSRIEAGRIQALYKPTDLAALTEDLASMFRSAMERAGLRLVVDCPSLEQEVYIDRSMWEKIVLNLLSNSFKYTFEGEVAVSLRIADGQAELRVRDTGEGIPEAALPRIFERFHRVEGTRGRSSEGSGIGLALVAELVKLHGGITQVESRIGQGTEFVVRIPLGYAHLPVQHLGTDEPVGGSSIAADPYVEEALRWLPDGDDDATVFRAAGIESTQPCEVPGERLRVLVVDDNADMRQYLQRLLGAHYIVQVAADGASALQAALTHPPALVLTDVMMPRLDGHELLTALRSHETTRKVPVLMLSARAGDGYRIDALKAGADDYIVKPFSAGELLARVAVHLQMASLREESLRSLADSEQRYRALVAATSDSIYRMSADWSEMRFLRGRQFLLDTHEPDRSWLEKYVAPEDQPHLLATIRAAIDSKSTFQLEHPVLCVDGSRGWTFSRAIPVMDANGEILEWFGAASNVTARRQAEDAAREADRRKDEFLAVLSHELRNPLAPLKNGIRLLRLLDDPRAIERTRAMMERQISQLIGLVDDLLDMTRINQGKVRLRRESLDLCATVMSAIDSLRPSAEAQRQRIVVDLPSQPIRVHADAVRLGQVLGNLLNNAVKFTPEGGEIGVAVEVEGALVRVTVSDTGIGIPHDKLQSIFEMFSQVDSTTERARSGLGIGLTLARRLVELHGGTLEARSDGTARGSAFTVSLPRETHQPENPTLDSEDEQAPKHVSGKRRLLVVDDNIDAASTVVWLLSLWGHEAHACHQPDQAIVDAERLQPEVILLDIGMPGMSGWDVCRSIRAHAWGRAMKIHALTGYGQPDDHRRAREAGFDGHLTKPVDFAELERILATAAQPD